MSAETRTELKRRIKYALDNSRNPPSNPEQARQSLERVSEEIAAAVDVYVQAELARIILALKTPSAFTSPSGGCIPGPSITEL